MSIKENSTINSLQSEMKQMFQDMMSQLGTLSSVLAKAKDKPSSASSKEAGYNEADDVSDEETSEIPEESDMGRKPIFEVSEPMKAFLQSAFCKVRPADNKTRCLKLDSILKSKLSKDAIEFDRKLSRLQNFVLDAAGASHGSD